MSGPSRGRALARGLWLAAALASGCRREPPEAARARAEEAILVRQIAGLNELVDAAEKGPLLRADQIAIAIDETLVESLIRAGLPQRRQLAGRYDVRLDQVEVAFRGSRGVVELRGRVSHAALDATFADLRLIGGLARVQIHPSSGLLTAQIVLDDFEVLRAAASGAESEALDGLVEELGRERSAELSGLLPAIEIPIRLEQEIAFAGFGDGPVSVPGGSLPVRLSVARLVPFAGRLWVVLDAGAGPWRAKPRGSGR